MNLKIPESIHASFLKDEQIFYKGMDRAIIPAISVAWAIIRKKGARDRPALWRMGVELFQVTVQIKQHKMLSPIDDPMAKYTGANIERVLRVEL